jgi:hypothetical protein
MEPQWFFPLFVLMWLGITALLSRVSGWSSLAERFRALEPASGESFHFVSGSMGGSLPVNYRSCLSVAVSDRGFHLSMLFLFRLGSPPLFIAWADVESIEEKRFMFMRSVVIRVRNQWPTIAIRGGAGDRIKAAYAVVQPRR